MKNTAQVYIFGFLMVYSFFTCQTQNPVQDASQNISKNKPEEKIPSDAGNISKKPLSIFTNCPSEIRVKKGESFQIKLPATSGTGYVWMFSTTPKLLIMKKTDEFHYEEIDGAVNNYREKPAPGKKKLQILEMTAIESGIETVELVYKRAHENAETHSEKCVVKVTVEN